jgi:hypothetical protein
MRTFMENFRLSSSVGQPQPEGLDFASVESSKHSLLTLVLVLAGTFLTHKKYESVLPHQHKQPANAFASLVLLAIPNGWTRRSTN